jgi:small subunit ribosomal protein S6
MRPYDQKEVLFMANVLAKYEMVIIAKADLGDEATAALFDKFKDLIASNGTVDAVDEWGKRRLAYPINDETDGFYVQINFTSGSEFPAELDRQLKINDAVLRSLIIRLDK